MQQALRRMRTIGSFVIAFLGIAMLGLGIKTISPGFIILGLLIVFASAPLLGRH